MSNDPARGRSLRRTWTIVAIAASLLMGAGLSALRLGADDRPQASARASSPVETASAAAIAGPARASVAAPGPPLESAAPASASAALEGASTSAPAEAAPRAAEAAGGVRRNSAPLVARSRAGGAPPVVAHVESAPRPESPAPVPRAAIDQPIGGPGSSPTTPRPSHPIDAVNPYGP